MNIKAVEALADRTFLIETDKGERFFVSHKASTLYRGAVSLYPLDDGAGYQERPFTLPPVPEDGAEEMTLKWGTDDVRVMALAVLSWRIAMGKAEVPAKPELPPLGAAEKIVADFRRDWQEMSEAPGKRSPQST